MFPPNALLENVWLKLSLAGKCCLMILAVAGLNLVGAIFCSYGAVASFVITGLLAVILWDGDRKTVWRCSVCLLSMIATLIVLAGWHFWVHPFEFGRHRLSAGQLNIAFLIFLFFYLGGSLLGFTWFKANQD